MLPEPLAMTDVRATLFPVRPVPKAFKDRLDCPAPLAKTVIRVQQVLPEKTDSQAP